MATIITTYVVILVAYFSGNLRESYFNNVDNILWRSKRSIRGNGEKVQPEVTPTGKAKRIKAVEGVILALSDQQLVTGLAILIAGFVKCDISIYLFNNVFALAWFSCTTHLATLTVLKR